MNAPIDRSVLRAEFQMVPVAEIAPSETPAQVRRRARFTESRLDELADSIKHDGVQQPIVIRPRPQVKLGEQVFDDRKFEIIQGERRWLATQRAGFDTVPALIREVADADLPRLQLIENAQREGLTPLEEAQAMQDVIDEEKCKAEDLVAMIGKQRSTVFKRLALLKLPAEVLEALETDKIDTSKAELICKFPSKKLQLKALELALQLRYDGSPKSYRQFAGELRNEFMMELDDVPFALDDDTLEPGPCTTCPHFSGNDETLSAELAKVHGAGSAVCTDKPCHDRKVVTFYERRIERARAQGRRVIEGNEAKALKPQRHGHDITGLVDLDTPCYEAEVEGETEIPTYRTALKGDALVDKHILFIDPHGGRPREVVEQKALAKALKKHGVKYEVPVFDDQPAPASDEEIQAQREAEKQAAAKRKAREAQELAFRVALLREIHAKYKGPLKRDDLMAIADELLETAAVPEEVEGLYETEIETKKMSEKELVRLLVEICVLAPCLWRMENSPAPLLAMAKTLRIDVAKVKKATKQEAAAA